MQLRNGDRIRGEVVSLSEGRLRLRTDYAGEIALRTSEVVALSTSRPVTVMRAGMRAPLRGTLQPLYGARVLLVTAEGAAHELSLDEIAYLNPRPWESGVGVAYSGRVALSASYTRGNTEDEEFHGESELDARAREYRYALSAAADRRESATAWRGGASYDRFLAERRFAYTRASVEHDRPKDIERRASLGAGLGADLSDFLSVRGGLDYVALERYAGDDERYPALGWGVKARYDPWFHEQEGFWNLEDTGSVSVRSKTGVRFPVWQRLGLRAQLNLDWEREPAPGRKSTDSTLLVGIDYAW